MQFTKLFSLIFSEVTILDFLFIWWSIHRCLSVLIAMFSITVWKKSCPDVFVKNFSQTFFLEKKKCPDKNCHLLTKQRLINTFHFKPRSWKIYLLPCVLCVCSVYIYHFFATAHIAWYLYADSPLNTCTLLQFK